MLKIVKDLRQFNSSNLNFHSLGEYVQQLDISNIDFQSHLPLITNPNNYSRNILLLEPLECVLLHWPPGVESAVHFHQGFWGFVLVLEGTCDNIEYKHTGNQLKEIRTIRAIKAGVIAEPDGIIHKIANPSKTETLVTCHIYYPALETLDGLALYNMETGTIGILNEKAKTASFSEPKEHFKEWNEKAFEVNHLNQPKKESTHQIFPVIPKPSANKIKSMISRYYGEQAKKYDQLDLQRAPRKQYLDTIDRLIANDLDKLTKLENLLAIASGTGRRTVKIRNLTGRKYKITGVDICEEMCLEAEARNIQSHASAWLDVELPNATFEAATILYAFGHIPSLQGRKLTLEKIYNKLSPEGVLFLDVFNSKDQHEWGPNAITIFEELELQEPRI